MKKSMKLLALAMALIMMTSVAAGCGKKNKNNTSSAVASQGVVMQKPEAKSVVDSLNTNNAEVEVVKEANGTNRTVFSNTEEKKLWVSENAASGGLDSVTYKLAYTQETREAKLAEFYAQMKVIMMSCDQAMTSERADELVAYLSAADRGFGVESVKTIENENGFNYAIHYLSSPAQVDFIVGVNAYK